MRFRCLIVVLALCLLPALASAQVGPSEYIAWDYGTADLTTYQITHFDACIDASPCATVSVTGGAVLSDTLANSTSFWRQVSGLTDGTHSIAVRACNASACSPATVYSFTYDDPAIPNTPLAVANLRHRGWLQ